MTSVAYYPRISAAAAGLALTFGVSPSFADLEQLSFTDTNGEQVEVKPGKKYINPVGDLHLYLSGGADRYVQVRVLDEDNEQVFEKKSDLLGASSIIDIGGKEFYGATFTLAAPADGSYTVQTTILSNTDQTIKTKDYELVVDTEAPVIGGLIKSESMYSNTAELNSGDYDGERILASSYVGTRLYVDDVFEDTEIKDSQIVISHIEGDKSGEVFSKTRAEYDKDNQRVIYNNALDNIFPHENTSVNVSIRLTDMAGNKSEISEIVYAAYECPEPPKPVAIHKEGTTEHYLGQEGYLRWEEGDLVHENPPQFVWRVEKDSLYPNSPYGFINFDADFEDDEYSYVFGNAPVRQREGNLSKAGLAWRSTGRTHCVRNEIFDVQLAYGVKKSPAIVNHEILRPEWYENKNIFIDDGDYYQYYFKGNVDDLVVRAEVEARDYDQLLSIKGGSCVVPVGETSCIIESSLSDYEEKTRVFSNDMKASDMDGNLEAFVMVRMQWDAEPLEIKGVDNDYRNSKLIVFVHDESAPLSDKYVAANFKPTLAVLGMTDEDDQTFELHTEDFSWDSETDGKFTIDYESLADGIYEARIAVYDQAGNETIQTIEPIIVDNTGPEIAVNIDNGDTVAQLDEIEFTVIDDFDDNVTIRSPRLTGGPTDIDIGVSYRSMGDFYQMEYPIIFPSEENGQYRLELEAEDAHGNVTTKRVSFHYEPVDVGVIGGMDGQVWVPAVDYEFVRKSGSYIIQSDEITIDDGEPIQGTYDLIAALRDDAQQPLKVNGQVVEPGQTTVVQEKYDFSANKSRIELPLGAAVEGESGTSHLLVTTSAPNSPVISVSVSLWRGDIELQSSLWEYRQVVDPLNIMAMPAPGVPCRVTTDKNAAKKADLIRDPVCYLHWTKTPDEAENMNETLGGLRVAGLVGSAIKVGEQPLAYDLFLFSGDGAQIQIGSGERTVEVISALDSVGFEPDLPDMQAMRKIETMEIGFTQTHGPDCELTTDADQVMSVARSSGEGRNRRLACLFEWVDLPDELDQDKRSAVPKAVGTLGESGKHPMKWRVSTFSKNGSRVTLQNGQAEIEVVDPIAPAVSFEPARGVQAHGDDVFIANINATRFGSALVESVNADLDVSVRQNGELIESETINPSRILYGQDIERVLNVPTDAAVWDQSDFEIEVGYTDFPEVSTIYSLTGYLAPKDSVRPVLESDTTQAVDTELLPLSVAIQDVYNFREPYDLNTMGDWDVRIIRQDTTNGNQAVTDWTHADGGTAQFQVAVDDVDTRTVRFLAEARLNSPISGYERIEQSQRPMLFAVLYGGEIDAEITTRKFSGEAPYKVSFRAVLEEREAHNSTGTIVWQISDDDGATWDDHIPEERYKFQFNTVLNKGKYLVRAVIQNKYSEIEATTEQVEVIAYEKPGIEIEGSNVVFVGTEETFTAHPYIDVANNDTGEIIRQAFDLDDASIQWSLDGGKSYTQQGSQIEISSDDPTRYHVWTRVRSQDAPGDDTAAYTVVKKTLEFREIRPPRVRVIGPTTVETGKSYEFSVSKALPYVKMTGEVNGFFTMPDGTIVEDDIATYTPTEDELAQGALNTTYTAWVEGYREAGAEGSHTLRSRVWQYTWPKFTVDVRSDAHVAPANMMLRVRTTNYSGKLESPRYEWDIPDAIMIVDASNPVARSIRVSEPGQYTVRVTVSDARDHETVLEVPIEIEQAEPYSLDLTYRSSPEILRDPVEIVLRSKISGGHPRDRIEEIEWLANGEVMVGTKTYGRTELAAGEHTLGARIVSRMGEEVTETIELEVAENKVPTCELTGRETTNSLMLRAECHDEDGRVRMFEWNVGGETYSHSSRSISVSKRRDEQFPPISLVAIDDSGGRSEPVQYIGGE